MKIKYILSMILCLFMIALTGCINTENKSLINTTPPPETTEIPSGTASDTTAVPQTTPDSETSFSPETSHEESSDKETTVPVTEKVTPPEESGWTDFH